MTGRTIRRAAERPPSLRDRHPIHPAPPPMREGEGLAMLTTIEPFTILTVDSGVLDYLHRLIYSKYVQYGARLAPQTEPIHEAHFDMLHRALISIEDARGLQHTVMRQPPAKAPEKTAPRRIKKVDASAAPPPRRLIRRDPPGERPSK